jgi:hypothetical protein
MSAPHQRVSLQSGDPMRSLDLTGADPEVVRVIRSVLPVFTHERDRPERIGTCLLIRLEGHAFVLTAAHVIDDVQRTKRRFTVAVGGTLFAIQRDRFVTRPEDPTDIGVIPLRRPLVELFSARGAQFLAAEEIDETDRAEGTDIVNTLAYTYFALGFPASRSQSRIQHAQKKIHVKGHAIRLTLAPTVTYPTGLSRADHILLDYNSREILLEGRSVNPPAVQGMSGGGIFRFLRRNPDTTKLVGVLIEHHKDSCVLVGTRAAAAICIAREVIASYPGAFL